MPNLLREPTPVVALALAFMPEPDMPQARRKACFREVTRAVERLSAPPPRGPNAMQQAACQDEAVAALRLKCRLCRGCGGC
jgi:hypothetical protein